MITPSELRDIQRTRDQAIEEARMATAALAEARSEVLQAINVTLEPFGVSVARLSIDGVDSYQLLEIPRKGETPIPVAPPAPPVPPIPAAVAPIADTPTPVDGASTIRTESDVPPSAADVVPDALPPQQSPEPIAEPLVADSQ